MRPSQRRRGYMAFLASGFGRARTAYPEAGCGDGLSPYAWVVLVFVEPGALRGLWTASQCTRNMATLTWRRLPIVKSLVVLGALPATGERCCE